MNKSTKLTLDLKAKIENGEFGYRSKIPSTHELARLYGITYPTAHRAIKALVDNGYLERKRGEGTYVAKLIKPRTKKVVLAITTEGHLFGEFAQEIFHSLQDKGFNAEVIPLKPNSVSLSSIAALKNSISDNPYAIIAEYNESPEYLNLIREAIGSGIPVIWTLCESIPPGLGGHLVTYDYFIGFCKIFHHLYSLGHRKIGCFAAEKLFVSESCFMQIINFVKSKYPELELIFISGEDVCDETDSRQLIEVKNVLLDDNGPSAVVCTIDFRAKIVIELARSLSIDIPEDISVTGFFNTPWAQSYSITSVDVRVKDIVSGLAELLDEFKKGNNNPRFTHRILVEPELIVRSTTGRE